ncbi:MAG TPA: CPBP family intramembrane glutamic endopeptidase [Polyangiaceae bacterium]|nr:CPBP family intramembrane glutamic endopeptidase [Polyangiaceae bacterium]
MSFPAKALFSRATAKPGRSGDVEMDMFHSTTMTSSAAEQRSALPFFILVFGSTWLFQLPFILAKRGWLSGPAERFMPLVVIGFFGPFLIAMALSLWEGGRDGLRALFRPLGVRGVGLVWYLCALALPCVLFLTARALCAPFFRVDLGPWFYPPSTAANVAAMLVIPFTEQIPWLGFAFGRLRERHGSLFAITAVGLGWALFHAQKHLFLDPGFAPGVTAIMILEMTAGAIVFGWMRLRARGSLLLAVVAHAGVYLNNPAYALPGDWLPLALHAFALSAAALAVVLGDRAIWRADPRRDTDHDVHRSAAVRSI